MRTKEEHEFEINNQKRRVVNQITKMIDDLQLLKRCVDNDPTLLESYLPQGYIDLASQYGKLCEMQRLGYAFK